VAELILTDLSPTPKWRVFDGYHLPPGAAKGHGEGLVWSTSPGEWTVLGDQPPRETVDLTHVRAMFRLTGDDAATLINRICSLDLTDGMFPNGGAARTLLAGVATEIIRDDQDDDPSYLLVPSSSYKTYLIGVIEDAGRDLGLGAT
jgi:sarcosine oxidase gamma subunit